MDIKFGPGGITMNDQVMNLVKGWFVIYKDKTIVTENDTVWRDVKRGEILILGIKWKDKFWTISGKTAYLQFKRGSVPISPSGVCTEDDIRCEERCIGYYEGNKKIIFKVNEHTGQMKPEVRDPENGTS